MVKWEDLPVEIQEKMLDEQEAQGNKRDAKVFMNNIYSWFDDGGFNWVNSKDGGIFWDKILNDGNFSEFYKEYPKEYVNVMFPDKRIGTLNGYYTEAALKTLEHNEKSWLKPIEEKKETNKIYVRKYK